MSWEIPNWNGLFCANAGATTAVLLYLFYSKLRVMPDSDTPQVMTGNQFEASHTKVYIIHNTQYDMYVTCSTCRHTINWRLLPAQTSAYTFSFKGD